MKQFYYILYLSVLVILASCSRAFDPDVRTGATPQLLEGHPDVRTSAIGFYDDEGNAVMDVDTDIVYNSLIYSSTEGVYEAGVGVQIQILAVNNGEGRLIKNESFTVDVKEGSRRLVESSETLHIQNRLSIDPGKYEVVVAVTDKSSGKTTRSSTNANIYDPASGEPDLTHVKILGVDHDRDKDPYSVTTYDIPGRVDSLRFQFFVTKPDAQDVMSINMRLIEFESDTMPPRDMSGIQPTPGSIQYRGINYNQSKILEEINRTLRDETGTILIEYTVPRPPRGNFRFQVTASSQINGDFRKARDFSAKSDNYPHIETTKEMARPLAYLMGRRDYERIRNIQDSDSLKQAVDNFWYSNLGSPDLARRVIELYYTRVEEANKQFSSFKEGWMTDMGMVYILFGPPYYVERSLDTYTWIYGYDRGDPRRVFRFQRTRMDSDSHPFSHYILQRQRLYHTVEYQQREMWLNGSILNRAM